MDFQDIRTVETEIQAGDMRFTLSGEVVLSCEDSTAEVSIADSEGKIHLTVTEEDWATLSGAVFAAFNTLKQGPHA